MTFKELADRSTILKQLDRYQTHYVLQFDRALRSLERIRKYNPIPDAPSEDLPGEPPEPSIEETTPSVSVPLDSQPTPPVQNEPSPENGHTTPIENAPLDDLAHESFRWLTRNEQDEAVPLQEPDDISPSSNGA